MKVSQETPELKKTLKQTAVCFSMPYGGAKRLGLEIKNCLKPHPHLSLESQEIALKHRVVLGTMLWEMLSATAMIVIIMAANKCLPF